MSDNLFTIYSRESYTEADPQNRVCYHPFAREKGEMVYETVQLYFDNFSSVLLTYAHISAVITPSPEKLIVVTPSLAIRMTGQHLYDVVGVFQNREASAIGCWHPDHFFPVNPNETAIFHMAKLPLSALEQEDGVFANI